MPQPPDIVIAEHALSEQASNHNSHDKLRKETLSDLPPDGASVNDLDVGRLRLPFAILAVVLEDVTQSVAKDGALPKSEVSAMTRFADKFRALSERSGTYSSIVELGSTRSVYRSKVIESASFHPRGGDVTELGDVAEAGDVSALLPVDEIKRSTRKNDTARRLSLDGADKNSVNSQAFEKATFVSPRSRWCALILKIMRPSARMELSKVTYTVQEVWADYLQKIRVNEEGTMYEYSQAVAKVASMTRRQADGVIIQSDSTDGLESQVRSRCRIKCPLHPDSPLRTMWVALSLLVLLHDTVMLPFDIFFEPTDSFGIDLLMWFCTFFWAFDIIVSCITGRYVNGNLETRLRRIMYYYAKSWLLFDAFMVSVDVILAILGAQFDETTTGHLTAIRCIRILKLLRLARLTKVKFMLRSVFTVDTKVAYSFSEFCKLSLLYTICVHMFACIWYGIGRASDNGWGNACKNAPTATLAHCYFRAAHWAMSHIHGTTHITYETTLEWAMSTISMILGFCMCASFVARVCELVAYTTSTRRVEMRQWVSTYSKRRMLSSNLANRLLRSIEAGEREEDVVQNMQKEREMMQMLSVLVQAEILDEIRKPLITSVKIFRDVGFISKRVVSQLCFEAITSLVCLSGDIAFASGEIGRYWRVVDFGCLAYLERQNRSDLQEQMQNERLTTASRQSRSKFDEIAEESTVAKVSAFPNFSPMSTPWEKIVSHVNQGVAATLQSGASISEMVLWTPWVHTGDLLGTSDTVLLQLGLELLLAVLRVRTDACLFVAKYAQRYVRQMTAARFGVSDLFQFADDDDEDDNEEPSVRHLIFLSHFKAEAGTEATLMQEAFQKLVQGHEGFSQAEASVFLDSEDLTDLATLKDHVVNSRNLVLLLSPNVLSRPWCLVEIVTAMLHGVQIVPVDIQRPGLKFVFPDEDYYSRMSNGELLSAADTKILMSEGITLKDIEDAVRFVFLQIALPFSPHKSKGIREAELQDILRRCLPKYSAPCLSATNSSQWSKSGSNSRTSVVGGHVVAKKQESYSMPPIQSEGRFSSSNDDKPNVNERSL